MPPVGKPWQRFCTTSSRLGSSDAGHLQRAPLRKPELVRPLLDVGLGAKMLFRGQDNGGGKMGVDQLEGVFTASGRCSLDRR